MVRATTREQNDLWPR